MRRFFLCLLLACCGFAFSSAEAATGRVIKALPFFLDKQGRHALTPSLYDRDAYQAYLRQHPDLRSGMLFAVQWKAKGQPAGSLKVRVELRGVVQGTLPRQTQLEKVVQPGGWFSHWTNLELTGTDYSALGEVTAWRVTLWEDNHLLGEQKSFLW